MNDRVDEPDACTRDAAAPPERRHLRRDALMQVGVIVLMVALLMLVARVLAGKTDAGGSWATDAVLAVAAVLAICWGAWQRYRIWTLPVRQLGDIVAAIREGELPLDELAKIQGAPAVLTPVLRDLLEELRNRRSEIQRLEQEMNQRIANRTDALERMLGTLREKASRDPLTGLYNRRMLDETLSKVVARCLEKSAPLTVLMIDVDYFKLLNDSLGHAAGDELLRSIGQIVRSTARETDCSFRCGGDEFVVVMEDADAAAGRALSERLVSLVDALARTLRLERRPRLSVGLAQLGDVMPATAEALLQAADRNLYEVKAQHKQVNLVVPAGSPGPAAVLRRP